MLTLKAEPRKSGHARSARRAGLLPAVVYGRREKSTPIAIPLVAFEKALKSAGESTVIALEGIGAPKSVLINDVVYDAVSGALVHADLYAIEKGQTVFVSVPLEFVGVSNAVKSLGGILTKIMHELAVEGEPESLPHSIAVDISALADLDSQIHVRDLVLPQGVKLDDVEPDEVVAMISVAEEEPVEAAPVDLSAIEVEKKGKKEEEAAPAPEE